MQTFKRADWLISTSLVAAFSIAVLINPSLLFTAYFIVGGWQLLSMIIHSLKGWFLKKGGARRVYQRVVIILLVMVLLSQLITPFCLVFFFLLFGSPVLAVIYTLICYAELKELKSIHSFNLR